MLTALASSPRLGVEWLVHAEWKYIPDMYKYFSFRSPFAGLVHTGDIASLLYGHMHISMGSLRNRVSASPSKWEDLLQIFKLNNTRLVA